MSVDFSYLLFPEQGFRSYDELMPDQSKYPNC